MTFTKFVIESNFVLKKKKKIVLFQQKFFRKNET